MKFVNSSIPISDHYRAAIFFAVKLQVILGILSLFILDGGESAQILGVALVAFWAAVTVQIWRNPKYPTITDIRLIRFGYPLVVLLAYFLVQFIWHLRGVA